MHNFLWCAVLHTSKSTYLVAQDVGFKVFKLRWCRKISKKIALVKRPGKIQIMLKIETFSYLSDMIWNQQIILKRFFINTVKFLFASFAKYTWKFHTRTDMNVCSCIKDSTVEQLEMHQHFSNSSSPYTLPKRISFASGC